jgi:hypothetical protein
MKVEEKPKLQRVRKQDAKIETFVKPDGFLTCLECWKTWMLSDDRDLSASRMKLGDGRDDDDHAGYESDVYADQRKADYKIGEATNAMIESMSRIYSWAIYRRCGITTQWNFPNADFIAISEQAEIDLRRKLKLNIATATLF